MQKICCYCSITSGHFLFNFGVAIYSQLSLAKNVKLAIYSQLSLAKNRLNGFLQSKQSKLYIIYHSSENLAICGGDKYGPDHTLPVTSIKRVSPVKERT